MLHAMNDWFWSIYHHIDILRDQRSKVFSNAYSTFMWYLRTFFPLPFENINFETHVQSYNEN
jgi:hypothetical protein